MAKELGVEALPLTSPITEPVDILFLGNSYYAFTIDPEVRTFIASLSKDKVGKPDNEDLRAAAEFAASYK
ncbi:hypothetical protein DYE50_05690 [Treponema ruminis]|nr:hypothetical protein DYE50_05690 [Treponema ruminis]